MTGIVLACEGENGETINYEYRCRDAKLDGATAVTITNAYTAQHGEIVINVAD